MASFSPQSPHLRGYLARIGHPAKTAGSPLPPAELPTLAQLHWRHVLAIPFENLSLRLATAHGVSLEPQRIFDKLVTARRGGYCFEQNGLFGAALRGLGFDVIDGAARVVQGSASAPAEAVEEAPRLTDGSSSSAAEPLGVVQPRVELRLSGHDHHILFVRLGGRWWLVDVGFGGDCLPLPLLLPEGAERYAAPPPDETADAPYLGQGWADGLPVGRMARYRLRLGLPGLTAPPDAAATPHFALRAGYYLQYRSAGTGEWRDLYFFRLDEFLDQDFALANHYIETNPASFFVTNLVAVRTTEQGRVTLCNDTLKVWREGEAAPALEEAVEGEEQLHRVLAEHFGVRLGPGAAA